MNNQDIKARKVLEMQSKITKLQDDHVFLNRSLQRTLKLLAEAVKKIDRLEKRVAELDGKEVENHIEGKTWHRVRVIFDDGEIFDDEILGLNADDALKNAKNNWEDAVEVRLIK